MTYFDSDYMEGAHHLVMERLLQTNFEHTVGYGKDHYCFEAADAIRRFCGTPDALVQFLPGGTQTNSVVIDALLSSHEGVLAAESAHINGHEAGAIEHSGHKVITLKAEQGKISASQIDAYIRDFYSDDSYPHMVFPGMVYITQATECGTLYSLAELEAISEVCRSHNIPLYLDGARLGYALASPQCTLSLKDIARLCDVFYIGGTKCGLLFGEAVVVRDPSLLPHLFTVAKQHGGITAKGRLLGIQFSTLFSETEDGLLYESICRKAVSLAFRLRDAMVAAGYVPYGNSPTNQQFFTMPNDAIDRLRSRGVSFENWGPRGEKESVVRFVTSWATTEEDIAALEAALA